MTPPPGWTAWAEGVDCKVSSRWLVVANTSEETHRYVVRGERCGFEVADDLPASVVLVELVHSVTDARGLDDIPTSLLDLFSAGVSVPENTSYLSFNGNPSPHSRYSLTIWIGSEAPRNARALVKEIVRSIAIEAWG